MLPRQFDAFNHHDYTLLDSQCMCDVCENWRKAFAQLQVYAEPVKDHRIGCMCPQCVAFRRYRVTYLAVLNRRDLYCEASWHASKAEPELGWGPPFMKWVAGQVASGYNHAWWAVHAPGLSLMNWFQAFDTARVPEMSGKTIAKMLA